LQVKLKVYNSAWLNSKEKSYSSSWRSYGVKIHNFWFYYFLSSI